MDGRVQNQSLEATRILSHLSCVFLCVSAPHSQTILPHLGSHFPLLCQLQLAKIPGKASDWLVLGHMCATLDQSLCPKAGEWQGLVPKGGDCHMENHCKLKSHPNLGEVPSNSMIWTSNLASVSSSINEKNHQTCLSSVCKDQMS